MDISELAWGLVVIAAGIFLSVYGVLLFRFALLAMGFSLGMVGVWWLLDGQSQGMRLLVALVAGAVIGIAFYSMVRFGLYIAGAMLGVVIAILVAGIIDIFGPHPGNTVMVILGIGGLIGGGLFGHRLGNLVILLATAAMGALLVVDGLRVLFESRFGGDVTDVTGSVAQRLTLAIFLVIFGISALSQRNASKLRHRVVT